MKRSVFILFLIMVIGIFSFNKNNIAVAEEVELELNAPSVCLIEPISKKVIYEKDKDKKLYPASMTKMMGLSLVLEEIKNERLTWDDEVICSSYAASMGGTQIFLEENEKMPVKDLFKAVAVNSANDAIVALMEHLYGSKEGFLKKMNSKAKELGMNNTNFNNATGFDDESHYTTSYDMALLGAYLVSFGNDILQYTSLKEAYIREDTSSPFWLVNTNKLLSYYDGMDGLKTGFTTKAGYNLTSTAYRNGVRLVCTVMKEDTIAHRSQDTIRLLDYGFSKLKAVSLFDKGDVVSTFEIDKNLNKYLSVVTNNDVKIIINKEENEKDLEINAVLEKVDLPYIKDEYVGYLIIKTPSGMVFKYSLYAANYIEEINFFTYLLDLIKKVFL